MVRDHHCDTIKLREVPKAFNTTTCVKAHYRTQGNDLVCKSLKDESRDEMGNPHLSP